MSERTLADRAALVSGGAKGIGAAANVAIGDVDGRAGQALAAELGSCAMFVELNVTSTDAWSAALEQVDSRFGPISILVNNAGIGARTYIDSYDEAEYDRVVAGLAGTICEAWQD